MGVGRKLKSGGSCSGAHPHFLQQLYKAEGSAATTAQVMAYTPLPAAQVAFIQESLGL